MHHTAIIVVDDQPQKKALRFVAAPRAAPPTPPKTDVAPILPQAPLNVPFNRTRQELRYPSSSRADYLEPYGRQVLYRSSREINVCIYVSVRRSVYFTQRIQTSPLRNTSPNALRGAQYVACPLLQGQAVHLAGSDPHEISIRCDARQASASEIQMLPASHLFK